MEVTIHEAKTHLSRLIERAVSGEYVIIAKAGNPLVRLVRIEQSVPVLGSALHAFVLNDAWDAPLNDSEINELIGK